MTTLEFPEGFVRDAATAAYQLEDPPAADGRGPSVWDTFAHAPGSDLELMASPGLPVYRFSVAWPRIQPTGKGPANTAGLDHYERLVDELAGHGIAPVLTLYHWDLPQELEDSGGWGERDTAARFAEYAELVADRLGDRVRLWTTLNEPWCAAFLGYRAGRTGSALSLRAAHHLLLAHGLGVDALRSALPADSQVSITLNLCAVLPGATSPEATAAVRRIDGLGNRLFLDPLFRGHYPADVLRDTAQLTDWSFVSDADLAVISAPIDLLGINYCTPTLVDSGPTAEPGPTAWPGCEDVRFVQPPGPATAMGWAIDAQGLRAVVHRVHEEYAPVPLMITENGAAFDVGADGGVRDHERIDYLCDHLAVMHEAIEAGVDLRGYFVRSLLNNPTRTALTHA